MARQQILASKKSDKGAEHGGGGTVHMGTVEYLVSGEAHWKLPRSEFEYCRSCRLALDVL